MSAKAICEATGKRILNEHLPENISSPSRFVSINENTSWEELSNNNPWLLSEKLVAKPDQLIKRRGKLGLIKVNCTYDEAKEWIMNRMNKDQKIGQTVGKLKTFIIEPFLPHKNEEEAYVCIYSHRNGDTILFTPEGGVDIGDVDAKAFKFEVPLQYMPNEEELESSLLGELAEPLKKRTATFIKGLYAAFVKLHFTYLEINPLVITNKNIYILDLAAKLDATADFLCKRMWGNFVYPPPFGRDALPEEARIADLDSKSGASLKLTILNEKGRIWTMVAGGGASVIYSDTICELGGASELANYGEYSGAPSEQQTYEYAKTVIGLMTKEIHPSGKILIIGGGIANFTNVAATFKGIVTALIQYKEKLVAGNVSIFVRRAGPNYQEGLRIMRQVGETLGIPVHVFGNETHMTAIVSMALGHRAIPKERPPTTTAHTANFLLPGGQTLMSSPVAKKKEEAEKKPTKIETTTGDVRQLFTKDSKSIVYGMQSKAVQGMLDFDFVCSRDEPSVACMVYPYTADHKQKFYWGHKEILLPVYKEMKTATAKHPTADILITFASLRAAYDSTMQSLEYPQIKTIAMIAEGIPENQTRILNKVARERGVSIIGPATVGGVKPGCFKIGNTGGMMDNILNSKLYRPGSVAYVSRSGGMSNELNNIIANNTNGVYEGIAIGGDRYPGTTFMDHLLRYQADPEIKMLVLLGEVGGIEEYEVCEALKNDVINKPLIAWCIGTCASMFSSEVQFGHAGACAAAEKETAVSKNKALSEAGAYVPSSFDELGEVINKVYNELVTGGVIVEKDEVPPPTVPMDYTWARELGLIRKPSSFMTSVSDERGQELLYAGMPISAILEQDLGIGGVLALLWFQRRLPSYASKFFEMCLIITADHGPAVSGAHNTIVATRAGKDLICSLVSGLMTIGDKFGGALDGAARQFTWGYDQGYTPHEFVNEMKKQGKFIMGIGHRVKSLDNPDKRVEIVKDFVIKHFPCRPILEYALEVEKITTSKKPNLILNVDGVIGVCAVDLLRYCGAFTIEEADEYVEVGSLNGLFVVGRSMGFIGHHIDQKILKQGLYRHPWDDISYIMPEHGVYDQ